MYKTDIIIIISYKCILLSSCNRWNRFHYLLSSNHSLTHSLTQGLDVPNGVHTNRLWTIHYQILFPNQIYGTCFIGLKLFLRCFWFYFISLNVIMIEYWRIKWRGYYGIYPTINNISVTCISWRLVLLLEETGVSGENHWCATSHWQTLLHNVVSSTPRMIGIRTHNVSIGIY